MKIQFGTDGWRAIIAKEFTFDNLKTVSLATAKYFLDHHNIDNGVCVGYDTRFMSRQFAEFVSEIFSSQGIKTALATNFVPTPAISLYVKKHNLAGGVMITASHNPPSYNGFKVKADYGGSAHPEQVAQIEALFSQVDRRDQCIKNDSLIENFDLKGFYKETLTSIIDVHAIQKAKFRIGHHAMFGAGQGLVREILGEGVHEYHCEINPTFNAINPEPIPAYLQDYFPVFNAEKLDVAILNDGDADRIGMINERGEYVDSHKIFVIVLKYLVEQKKFSGEVARTYALTEVIDKFCEKHGLICHNLPIGFKHVGKLMTTNNVLIGGEESGGIGVTSHLPERDGIYIGLLVLEIMAKRGKALGELVQEIYDEFGFFTYNRIDARLTEAKKERAILRASQGDIAEISGFQVTRFEKLDGYKYFFEGGWLLIRPSGTEPVLRLYCEADTEQKVNDALKFALSLAEE